MIKRKSYINKLNESYYLIEDLISDYNKNYSDIPKEDFNKIIALDADSYLNQDTSKEPFKVGQLAGGNGILIKSYRKGDTSWLNDSEKCNEILKASKIFYKNRKQMPIKNPSQFESIDQFLDMVLNGAAVKGVERAKETEEERALAKIEKLRLSQFPSIPSNIFLKLIELDEDSDIKKGVVSGLVKTFLVPFYLKMIKSVNIDIKEEEKFLFSNPLKIKKLLYEVSEKSMDEIKKIINEYNSFIILYSILFSTIKNSIYLDNLEKICIKGKDYEYLGSTDDYDLVISKSLNACRIANRANFIYNENIPFGEWCYTTSSINDWCTGNQLNSFNRYGGLYINIIWRRYKDKPDGISHQITLYPDGNIQEVCAGQNKREYGYKFDWENVEGEIRNHNITSFNELENKANFLSVYLADLINIFKNNIQLVYALKNYASNQKSFSNNLLLNFIFGEVDKLMLKDKEKINLESYIYSKETIDEAEERKKEILELIIPEGITSIPQGRFEKWVNLINIKFPTSLKEIGPRAFANCISLKKLNLNEGLETIAMGAFSGCSNLSGSIALPFSISRIEPFAFEGHNKKGLSFTLPTAFFNPELNKKLLVPIEPEDEKNWWFQKGRFKERM